LKMYISIKTKFILLLSVLMAAVLGVQFYLNYKTQQEVFDELAMIYTDFNQLTDTYLLHLPPPPQNLRLPGSTGKRTQRHSITQDNFIIDIDQDQLIVNKESKDGKVVMDHVLRFRSSGEKEDSCASEVRMVYNYQNLAKVDSLMGDKQAIMRNIIRDGKVPRFEVFIPDFSIPAKPKVIKYKYNEAALNEMMNAMRTRNLLATLLLFGLSITGIVMVTRKFLKPIDSLKQSFAGVVNGNLDVTVASKNRDEMGDLARSFNHMVDELKKNKQKEVLLQRQERLVSLGELSAGVAHEIKNPLNTINLTIDHLKDSLISEKNRKAGNYIINIQREVQRLDKLVNNFLNYVRSESLQKGEVDLQVVINEIFMLYEREMKNAGIEVQNDIKGTFVINADRERLKTALVNLIINAIQAMPKGGVLTIKSDSNKKALSIEDTGKGIPQKLLEKVFDPFFSTKEGGTGLGLPTSYKIINEHEGQLTIESEENKGTLITVKFK
jgi:signal transduction histidine kinase